MKYTLLQVYTSYLSSKDRYVLFEDVFKTNDGMCVNFDGYGNCSVQVTSLTTKQYKKYISDKQKQQEKYEESDD